MNVAAQHTATLNLWTSNIFWLCGCNRVLRLAQDGDEGVALESCEFWTAFCEAKVQPSMLRPFLGRLVPVLLKNMVYDEYDEEVMDALMIYSKL